MYVGVISTLASIDATVASTPQTRVRMMPAASFSGMGAGPFAPRTSRRSILLDREGERAVYTEVP